MVLLHIRCGELNARPNNLYPQGRSRFSSISKLLIFLVAVVFLPRSIGAKSNNSLLHLVALSSLSASAFSSSSSGGNIPPSSRTSSVTSTNPQPFSTTAILARQEKSESQDEFIGSTNKASTDSLAPTSAGTHNSGILQEILTRKNTMRQFKQQIESSPRARACILMTTAMALHFGGYEFARSAALALFTSSETGFTHPSAYPFAIGLVTPTTLSLLYWYGTLLKSKGPRKALKTTTAFVLGVLFLGDFMVSVLSSDAYVWDPRKVAWLTRAVVAPLFVFQNSYAHLIYTQQWSFLGSVMTPTEGTRWFTFVAGFSSLVCTFTASSVKTIADRSYGLVLLVFLTCATLGLSMLCADTAYDLAAKHGFDPSQELQQKQAKKDSEKQTSKADDDESLLAKTGRMFQTSPTLVGLFGEVITFQALSTVLNVCFVRQLKAAIPSDGDRAAFTGNFYAGVNGISGTMQFFLLPLLRKYLEPQWIYRLLPTLLMPLLAYAAVVPTSASDGLKIAAVSFFALKAADYSVRGVATELVYQPLDFDARYLGKEVIGVFANRFGKSGTSMILSGLASFGLMAKSTRPMSQLAVGVGGLWSVCSFYLSRYVVTNRQAEEQVQKRRGRKSANPKTASATVGDQGDEEPTSSGTKED